MPLDRRRFLQLALAMGAGTLAPGCTVIVEEENDGTGTAGTTTAPTQGGEVVVREDANRDLGPCVEWDSTGECMLHQADIESENEAAIVAAGDGCTQWDATGECIGWAAPAPTQECVGWTPAGECNAWQPVAEVYAPVSECVGWDPSGECIQWS